MWVDEEGLFKFCFNEFAFICGICVFCVQKKRIEDANRSLLRSLGYLESTFSTNRILLWSLDIDCSNANDANFHK